FFQAEDGIRDFHVTGVQTCALPICTRSKRRRVITMSAVKNVIRNNFRNMELNEFLAASLKDAGYGGVEVQKTPVGARITVFVTRPGLVIGRKGSGIKDLM